MGEPGERLRRFVGEHFTEMLRGVHRMPVGGPLRYQRWVRRFGPVLSMVLLASACNKFEGGGIADVVATVKGTIDVPERAQSQGTPCRLDLLREGRPDVVRSTNVQGQFVQKYGLAPGRYYFVVTCEGYEPFRSEVYNIKDVRYMKTPIDFGVLTFR